MNKRLGERAHIVFPLWAPVGGVIKILDYLHHTVECGFDRATAWGPRLPGSEAPIRHHDAFERAHRDPRIDFGLLKDMHFEDDSFVLFSEPSQHPDIELAMPAGADRRRIIHLVQNTRHANPNWHLGFPYLLLHRPVTRIFVTHEVANAVEPVMNHSFPSTTIVEGHGWEYFSRSTPAAFPPPDRPLRVGYTTWKSSIGDDVAATYANDSRIEFEAIRKPATWPELRELYHRCDVWLSAPGPEEGFYLPGLEAMAASLVVISALVGGNRAYLRPGENCLEAGFEDVGAHKRAIDRLLEEPGLGQKLLRDGHQTTQLFTLERERSEFADFLERLIASSPNPPAATK